MSESQDSAINDHDANKNANAWNRQTLYTVQDTLAFIEHVDDTTRLLLKR